MKDEERQWDRGKQRGRRGHERGTASGKSLDEPEGGLAAEQSAQQRPPGKRCVEEWPGEKQSAQGWAEERRSRPRLACLGLLAAMFCLLGALTLAFAADDSGLRGGLDPIGDMGDRLIEVEIEEGRNVSAATPSGGASGTTPSEDTAAELPQGATCSAISQGNRLYFRVTDAENHCVELYNTNGTGTSCYAEYEGKVVVPDVISAGNGLRYRVTRIGTAAFRGCGELTDVRLPDSVTEIGESGFSACRKLSVLWIPDDVTAMGKSAFYSCRSLTGVQIPDGVTVLEESVFYDCRKLKEVEMGAGIRSIEQSAFAYCDSLSAISIPRGVERIGYQAFYNAPISELWLPAAVTTLEAGAFELRASRQTPLEVFVHRDNGLEEKMLVKVCGDQEVRLKRYYTAVFDPNGGWLTRGEAEQTMTYAFDQAPPEPEIPAAERRGYRFSEWVRETVPGEGTTYTASWISLEDLEAPLSLVTLSVDRGSFEVQWTDLGAEMKLSGYELYVAEDAGFEELVEGYGPLVIPAKVASAPDHYAAVMGLPGGRTYYVRVRAFANVGDQEVLYSAYCRTQAIPVKAGDPTPLWVMDPEISPSTGKSGSYTVTLFSGVSVDPQKLMTDNYVRLTAIPEEGMRFAGWKRLTGGAGSGAAGGSGSLSMENPLTLRMSRSEIYQPLFAPLSEKVPEGAPFLAGLWMESPADRALICGEDGSVGFDSLKRDYKVYLTDSEDRSNVTLGLSSLNASQAAIFINGRELLPDSGGMPAGVTADWEMAELSIHLEQFLGGTAAESGTDPAGPVLEDGTTLSICVREREQTAEEAAQTVYTVEFVVLPTEKEPQIVLELEPLTGHGEATLAVKIRNMQTTVVELTAALNPELLQFADWMGYPLGDQLQAAASAGALSGTDRWEDLNLAGNTQNYFSLFRGVSLDRMCVDGDSARLKLVLRSKDNKVLSTGDTAAVLMKLRLKLTGAALGYTQEELLERGIVVVPTAAGTETGTEARSVAGTDWAQVGTETGSASVSGSAETETGAGWAEVAETGAGMETETGANAGADPGAGQAGAAVVRAGTTAGAEALAADVRFGGGGLRLEVNRKLLTKETAKEYWIGGMVQAPEATLSRVTYTVKDLNQYQDQQELVRDASAADGRMLYSVVAGEYAFSVKAKGYLNQTKEVAVINTDRFLEPLYLRGGDINGDGRIDLSDWTLLLSVIDQRAGAQAAVPDNARISVAGQEAALSSDAGQERIPSSGTGQESVLSSAAGQTGQQEEKQSKTTPEGAAWDENGELVYADLNGDGWVDGFDAAILLTNYSQTAN